MPNTHFAERSDKQKMLKSNSILIFILLSQFVSCSEGHKATQDNAPNPEAIRLNDIAVEYISKAISFDSSENKNKLDSALIFLDSAQQLDSRSLVIFSNKTSVLNQLGRHEESLETHKKFILGGVYPAEVAVGTGFMYEKLNKKDSALQYYKQGLELYKNRLKDKKKSEKQIKADIAFVYLLLEKPEKVNKIISELKDNYPDDEETQANIEMLESFDKEAFLKQY